MAFARAVPVSQGQSLAFLAMIMLSLLQGIMIQPFAAGFIVYGLLFCHAAELRWKLSMIVTGGMTFLLSIFVFWFYPNNPAEARFLTPEERLHLVKKSTMQRPVRPSISKSRKASFARQDAPRYYPAWIIQIAISWVGTPTILLVIDFILSRRNKEQRAWIVEQEAMGKTGTGVIKRVDEGGEKTEVEVDMRLFDLTDLENSWFIYPL
ncbi:hypothetical protein H2200_007653 [Cladophialophora chaetospira]|uniref:Uncharacterized protein n=1 Tax=Cladophialophora chaetospira TaxID=386627 RepID=A0AA38X654_9EURO|nr:hypothetical protein H2200_007653 [Cladophialophora chaetospira]